MENHSALYMYIVLQNRSTWKMGVLLPCSCFFFFVFINFNSALDFINGEFSTHRPINDETGSYIIAAFSEYHK